MFYALLGGHVVDALRDDIAAALDLQQDGRRVGELVPVRQGRQAARTHHPVQLSLHGIRQIHTCRQVPLLVKF